MPQRKGISYQWRLFVPVVMAFWFIIISMACWQIYRVREIKKEMVYNQLAMVAERVSMLYDINEGAVANNFVSFINDFFEESADYDPMVIRVKDADGNVMLSIGGQIPDSFVLTGSNPKGVATFTQGPLAKSQYGPHYIYYGTLTHDGIRVLVMLPYTKNVARALSASTTRFWLIFFGIAVFVTIFAYISASYFSRNIKVLRNFAMQVAENPKFTGNFDTGTLPHDELGEISRQIITLYRQKVAEYERREREHKVALHAVEEKDRVKRELTSNINHELKTPVGVIQGYIDTIVSDPDMPAATREKFLIKTQESVHRLTSLIADITAITKLESNGRLVNIEDINFHDLVFTFENYINEANVLAGKMEFSYDIPLDCRVLGNESLLTSVLLNFTKNAVAYSAGTACCLEYVGTDNGMVHLRYYDNGVGVPPEHLPHMFERFYRVNSGRSRNVGGTGLGLTIAEVTIHSLGGHIEVSNRYPSGLQFDFTLPAPKESPAKENAGDEA